tara:strand:+ start:370 stop:519 length:150 start_codon:yes stop_codon:yes gene_type:complete
LVTIIKNKKAKNKKTNKKQKIKKQIKNPRLFFIVYFQLFFFKDISVNLF